MADAFRAALRRPDFANRPVEEHDTPESNQENNEEGMVPEAQLVDINKELAEEGRDIRSVSSGRGVRVDSHLGR
jgi:hypothetical protein